MPMNSQFGQPAQEAVLLKPYSISLIAARRLSRAGKEVEQGFKSCASLMKLEKRYGSKRLDNACERVLRLTSQPTVRNISVLCKSSAEKQPDYASVKKEGGHGITRGAAYYNKGGKRDE